MSEGSYSVVYAGLRHALGESDSWAFRGYAVVGTLCAILTAILFVLALPEWVLGTEVGALIRIGRAFLGLLGLSLVAVMVLPLVFVYRRSRDGRPGRDRLFGLAGFGFLASLYLALLVSAPEGLRDEPAGVFAPIVEFLYGLPQASGLVFPVIGALAVLGIEYGLDREGEVGE